MDLYSPSLSTSHSLSLTRDRQNFWEFPGISFQIFSYALNCGKSSLLCFIPWSKKNNMFFSNTRWYHYIPFSSCFFQLNLGASGPKLSKTVMPLKRLQVLQEELGHQGHRLAHHLQMKEVSKRIEVDFETLEEKMKNLLI